MIARNLVRSDTLSSRLMRVAILMVVVSMIFGSSTYCPTGLSNCEMDGMAEGRSDGGKCLLACEVPMQLSAVDAPRFSGLVSVVNRTTLVEQSGGSVEPDLPPPRKLM